MKRSLSSGASSSNSSSLTLPFQTVNLVVLTDVHSWIAGHERHEPALNADYGDVLSFFTKLRDCVHHDHHKQDLFLVMNGDFMDGTGLSTVPPVHLTPLLEQMPFDIVNLGNHELYHEETVEWIRNEFIPHWKGHYLTSNTLWKATGEPLGDRWTYLYGRHSTLLVFGFLYNFEGNCDTTIVERVEEVVQQDWFWEVLQKQDKYDAILVMAHMHVTDPLVDVIRLAIRNVVGSQMPIQFITGHTHIRAFAQLDDYAASFEAGRFLDTVGFCSFPIKNRNNKSHTGVSGILAESNSTFAHVFLNPNQQELSAVLAALSSSSSQDMETAAGRLLTNQILTSQQELGLNQVVGCSPANYHLDAGMDSSDSIWGLYMYQIVPTMLLHAPVDASKHKTTNSSSKFRQARHSAIKSKRIYVQGTGAFRYDLFQGTVVLDDVIAVCPFEDILYEITTNLTGKQFLQVLNVSSSNYPNQVLAQGAKYSALPYLAVSTPQAIADDHYYDLWTSHFHREDMVRRVEQVLGYPIPDPSPVPDSRQNGQYWTTTNLWRYYIEQEWPCQDDSAFNNNNKSSLVDNQDNLLSLGQGTAAISENRDPRRPNVAVKERPFTVAFFIILIVGGLYLYQKRKQYLERSGYVPIGDPTTALLRSQGSSRSSFGY